MGTPVLQKLHLQQQGVQTVTLAPLVVERVQYGDVEIASEVGWDVYKRVADGIVKLLDATGLLHGYSFNSWSDVVAYDNAFVEEWLDSPQTSLYTLYK